MRTFVKRCNVIILYDLKRLVRLGAAESTWTASCVVTLPLHCGVTLPLLLNARGAMRSVKKNTSKGKINEREESKSFKEQFQALVASKRKTPAGTEKHIRACKRSRSGLHCLGNVPVCALLGPLWAEAVSPVDVLHCSATDC